jgi:hypothetical protein
MIMLPIAVPANQTLDVVPLNENKINKSQPWGFFEINESSQDRTWPDKSIMAASYKLHNPGDVAYRCRVSNHGTLSLIYLGIFIDLAFGGGDSVSKRQYTVVISGLDPGRYSDFYVLNDCGVSVHGVWEDTAKVQILGEQRQRNAPLRRSYKNLAEQIMMFFGTSVRWTNQYPCE